ncbi:unnamed protein product [Kuraishia capsulata CBS 1993]|uniref:TauD/TfdA-like domain-containing protein n=1 Tax=Kuraishia capsulata CBS 1993 TaxID=1382522 RepID=W6MSJ6_9ASCO|nr:uncharacterized protein KUCA_T00005769001 [Kuraishia capsulata CBS 1993]CDK29776.1 unnamed protein product [Kuraishia capsulata CBS 1993]
MVFAAITTNNLPVTTHFRKDIDTVKDGVLTIPDKDAKDAKYPQFLPTWDPSQKYPKLEPFHFVDRGFFGDPGYERLLADADGPVDQFDLTPKLGTEIRSGIQLSTLSPEAKDDLALLVERRGVVVFRNQDFKDRSPDFVKKWGEHFGPLHIHPTTSAPKDHPELHIVYIRPDPAEIKRMFATKMNSCLFHSDVSFELQPPGVTLYCVVQGPVTGGDTVFADTIEAYDRLSNKMKGLLDGLKAVHSGIAVANDSIRNGGIFRRDPVESIHPLVRYHPVLKKKALFAGNGFVTRILGLKDAENKNLLDFISNHIESSIDIQVHVRWEPGTVVLWDNRRILHSPTVNWDTPELRHAFRVTPQAERPVGSEEEYENWTPEKELEDLKEKERILSAFPDEVDI